MTGPYEITLIFVAVIFGIVSATYFYTSADIFMDRLKRPLQLIATGMIVMSVGVMLAAFISYESELGLSLYFKGMPLSILFYILYIVGSILILSGARMFTKKPKAVVTP